MTLKHILNKYIYVFNFCSVLVLTLNIEVLILFNHPVIRFNLSPLRWSSPSSEQLQMNSMCVYRKGRAHHSLHYSVYVSFCRTGVETTLHTFRNIFGSYLLSFIAHLSSFLSHILPAPSLFVHFLYPFLFCFISLFLYLSVIFFCHFLCRIFASSSFNWDTR
jgi:hypothetical protein